MYISQGRQGYASETNNFQILVAYNNKCLFTAETTCPIQKDRRALLIAVIQGAKLKGGPPSWTLSVISQQEREFQKVSDQQLNALAPKWHTHITSTHKLSELVTWPQPTIMVRKYNPTPSIWKVETWEYLWSKILTSPICILLMTASLKSQRCFFSTLCDFSFINGN